MCVCIQVICNMYIYIKNQNRNIFKILYVRSTCTYRMDKIYHSNIYKNNKINLFSHKQMNNQEHKIFILFMLKNNKTFNFL